MPIYIYLAAFAVFAGVILLLFAAFGAERLNPSSQAPKTLTMRDMRLQQNATDRVFAPIIGAVAVTIPIPNR